MKVYQVEIIKTVRQVAYVTIAAEKASDVLIKEKKVLETLGEDLEFAAEEYYTEQRVRIDRELEDFDVEEATVNLEDIIQ